MDLKKNLILSASYLYMVNTVLSRASAYGHSRLKHQNLRVGGYTENVLNYPQARAHPGCKVSCHGTKSTCIVSCPRFVEASSTVEKSVSIYKADQLLASLLNFRSVQLSLAIREFRAAG